MASSDRFTIKVSGKGAHGAYPWNSVDPVVTAAQIILGLQTIVSRQVKLIDDAAVVTVGTVNAGVRYNVIPPDVEMSGTIRALNPAVQKEIWASIRRIATNIAESAGATAEVTVDPYVPVTNNNASLMAQMLPTLQALAGPAQVREIKAVTGAEDFAYYQEKVPGVFLFVGGMKKGQDPATAADHHTAGFRIDESGLTLGVKTLATLAADYLSARKP
jgi:amidohydrolase